MNTERRTRWTGLVAVASLAVAAPLSAQDASPYLQPDDTWISIDGEVETVWADGFSLDYGNGVVTVEMDDGDRDADAYSLLAGDPVTVTGKVDDDLFEMTTIEASSVYVEDIGAYFYASPMDEEDSYVTIRTPVVTGESTLQGTVTAVFEEEFTLHTGLREITVETDDMSWNPLDDEGYTQIDAGDIVSVHGSVDDDFFEGREFEAERVIELVDSN